jgi:osmotically-inducible protein OsmY
MIVTSDSVVKKTARLNREVVQLRADIKLERQLRDQINEDKKEVLGRSGLRSLGKYEIHVMEGRVLLTGIVYNQEIKNYIVDKITDNVKVRELLDELRVGDVKVATISDFFIKRSIKAKIFFKTEIRSLNYEVSVINGFAYIIGIAQNVYELELMANVIGTVRGVNKVISYVITVDSNKKIKIDFIN